MATEPARSDDPTDHTNYVKRRLNELVEHLRDDIGKVQDPKAQALFETSAEVLSGLATAYEHYEQRQPAWQ